MKHKKILLGLSGGLVCLIILLVGVMLLLPYLINFEPVKERILAILFRQVGGKVEYQRLDLSFFPQPRTRVHQVRISIPEKAEGTLKSIQVFPDLLAMLRGTLRVKTIQVESPDFNIRLPEECEKLKEAKKMTALEEAEEIIARASGIVPEMEVIIEDGRFKILKGSTHLFSFSDLAGRVVFPPGHAKIGISCRSNLWEKISIEATLDPMERKGNGHMEVTNFYPRALSDSLSLGLPFDLGDSRLNLNLRFKMKGPASLQASVEGAIPMLTFRKDNEDMVLKGKRFQGAFQLEQERMEISIDELNLDYPQIRLSGKFEIDQKAPLYVLRVQGREVDVASTREAVLMLAGELPITKTIFNIVKEGKIPLITFQSRAHSISDLDKTENFSIKGSLLEGKIFIPLKKLGENRVDRTLEKASGQVAISNGVLEGRELTAQWKNQRLWEGKLKLGLKGENPLLHLEAVAEVDLSLLPPLLSRLIRDRAFLEEMVGLRQIEGRALGTLVLGESMEKIKAKIDIQDIQLLARHDRIPYSVTIDGGKVIFDEERLEVRNLAGRAGNSSFSDLSARVGFRKEPSLEVFSGRSVLSLEEIYSWLSSYDLLREALKNFKSVKGRVSLSDMRLKGPLKSLEKWDFDTMGELKNLVVDTSLLPGPLAMTDGKFRLQPEKIVFTDLETKLLNASFKVGGTLHGNQRGLEKADLDFGGRVTPKDIQWLSEVLGVKRNIEVRSPIQISNANLNWQKGVDVTLKVELAMSNGPKISLDVFRNPQELRINHLVVHEEISYAAIGLNLKGQVMELTFSGSLSERTLDNIFSGYPFHNGWLKGDFRANVLMDQWIQSRFQGRLEADHLSFPWQFEKPLTIDHLSLTGEGNHISISEARFAWGEMPFVLSGDMGFSRKRVFLDVALSTERVDVDQVTKSLSKERNAKGARDLPSLQAEGTIRFKSDSLTYGRFTWEPFRANIVVGQNGVEVNIEEAKLCGISTTGVVKVTDQELSLDVRPISRSRELESTAKCLLDETVRVTGDFELKGRIFAEAKPKDLFPALGGNLEFKAQDGQIYYLVGLARILEFVNLTEVYKGKIPDMKTEGLPYKLFTVIGSLQDSKLIIKEATFDGHTLQMAAQGEVYMAEGKVNLMVLVAPLRTVDRIINLIPLVRYILAGTLLTVPVKVSGDLKDPKVTALSPSAVGSELLGIMTRTLRLPLHIIQPLLPKKNNEGN
jgi:AsmA-like C-terminal region